MNKTLALHLVLALAACGSPPDDSSIEETGPDESGDPIVDSGIDTETGKESGDQPTDTDPTPTDTGDTSVTESGDTAETDPTDTDTDPVVGTGGTDTGDTAPTETAPVETAETAETGDTATTGTCVHNLGNYNYPSVGAPDVDFFIYDATGNEVYSNTWSSGTAFTDQVTLPTGHYYTVVRKEGSRLTSPINLMWADDGSLSHQVSVQDAGYDVQWMEIDCDADTASLDTAFVVPDTPPVLPAPWEDDGSYGACAFALQQKGTFTSGASEASWLLYDEERNLLASTAAGAWANNNQTTHILNLPNGRYLVEMTDTGEDGWNGGLLQLVNGAGDIEEIITLEDGAEGYAYLNVDCATDTSAYTPWDTDPDPTDIDTAWYQGPTWQGCPVSLAVNVSNSYVATTMGFEVLDSSGNVVYADNDAWLWGIQSSDEVQYAYAALPSGDYTLSLIDHATNTATGWGSWEYVRVYGDAGTFLGGGGHHGPNERQDYAFTVDCAQDTAEWSEGAIEDLVDDTGWSDMDAAWRDTDLAETCGYMMEVVTPYSASTGGWEILDLEGHVLYSVAPGDMTQGYAIYRTPVELPTGGYKLRMLDTSNAGFRNYSTSENFRLLDADGDIVEAWGMGGSGYGDVSEYFLLDCEDDTDVVTGWDSGWCEPVLDTAGASGSDCAAALHVAAGSDFATMGIKLTDSSGNVVLDAAPGTFNQRGDHYLGVDLTSDGYQLDLYSSDNTVWATDAYVEFVSTDGRCAGDEPLTEVYTLNDSNGFGGQRTVWFTHDCAADTGGDFAWDSGWCAPVLDTADAVSGACGYAVHVRRGSTYDEIGLSIHDSDGNLMLSVDPSDVPAVGDYYFSVNLPSDGYAITLEDAHPTQGSLWNPTSFVELLPANGRCVDEEAGTGRMVMAEGHGGSHTQYVTLNCQDDTSGDFAWDSGWCEPVLDSGEQPTGSCGMVAMIYAGYDYANLEASVTDADGNVVLDVQAGDLTRSGYHYLPFEAPSNGYVLHMGTTHSYNDNWANNGYIQFIPADGACIDESAASEPFHLKAFGERTEYLTFQCEDDTAEDFAWDSGWCPPVLDTADIPTGDCGYVLEVGTDSDAANMGIDLTDADGTNVFSIEAGDGQLTTDSIHHFPVNLPSNAYKLTLTDSSTSSYSDNWFANAYVRVVPVDDGCMDEDLASEKFRVDYDGLEIVDFVVDCPDDTGSFAGWDTGYCSEIIFTEADTAGVVGLQGCEQLLHLTTWYNTTEMQMEITDDLGNVVFEVDGATDLASKTEYFYAVDLPTGTYTATLTDTQGDSWIESYGSSGYKSEATLYQGNGECMGEELIGGPWTVDDLDGVTGVPESVSYTFSVVCDVDTAAP